MDDPLGGIGAKAQYAQGKANQSRSFTLGIRRAVLIGTCYLKGDVVWSDAESVALVLPGFLALQRNSCIFRVIRVLERDIGRGVVCHGGGRRLRKCA